MTLRSIAPRTRLPGVYFNTEQSIQRDNLPRMDIAGFVGFAASGPIHTPVPIENMNTFDKIFGGRLSLAWDHQSESMQFAFLRPTVQAFFRNGGKRCWVVRVAENAYSNQFVIPGVIRTDGWKPEYICARSAGSWSDNFRVGCSLTKQTYMVQQISFNEDDNFIIIQLSATRTRLSPGDLLRLTFSQRVIFLRVAEVASDAYGQTVRCPFEQCYFFLRQCPVDPTPQELQGIAEIRGVNHSSTTHNCQIHILSNIEGNYQLDINTLTNPFPQYGDMLYVTVQENQPHILVAPVMETQIVSCSETNTELSFRVNASGGLWINKIAKADLSRALNQLVVIKGDIPYADRFSFSLMIWQEQECIYKLDELGFCKGHPRFWAQLPTDEELYQLKKGKWNNPEAGSLIDQASNPRFPLAGPDNCDAIYIPFGMPFIPDPQFTTSTIDEWTTATHLARNGLSSFTSNLFLDSDLRNTGSQRLFSDANHKLHSDHGTAKLTGLHSLWNIDEVTLIAIPDAQQRGWQLTTPELSHFLAAPELKFKECEQIEKTSGFNDTTDRNVFGSIPLSWNPVFGAKSYTLQEASDSEFTKVITYQFSVEKTISLPIYSPCAEERFYRLRAEAGDVYSPWSNCCKTICPQTDFTNSNVIPLPDITLEKITGRDGKKILRWKSVIDKDKEITYVLEQSDDPAFTSALSIQQSQNHGWTTGKIDDQDYCIYNIEPGDHEITYYRMRYLKKNQWTPWSNTIIITNLSEPTWKMVESGEYNHNVHIEVQRAMLAFSAARGDTFAVLSAPSHYGQTEILEYKNCLQSPLFSLSAPLEERDLSFGALYHPWLINHAGTDEKNLVRIKFPADGAICGIMAATALGKGAWIAPAFKPIQEVSALEPKLVQNDVLNLFSQQVNTLTIDPMGVICLNADTLSTQTDLQSINVRLLLILLRKLALREGQKFVFQPNNADFRRRVKHHFEHMLEGLFLKGAFAGKISSEGYDVRVNETINSTSSIEEGRFIIEIRVAPSQPLVFLLVQLIQQENTGLSVFEV